MTIYEIIESIAAIGSTNAKKAILESHKDNEILKACFYYAYNPRFNYWIKAKTLPRIEGKHDIDSFAFVVLNTLINREVTGDSARAQIEKFMESLTAEAQEILCRIINHDLRCGASDTLAMKIWPGLVPSYPVMLCDKFKAKSEEYLKKFESANAFNISTKEDGGRVLITVDDFGSVALRSRNGSELTVYGLFDSYFKRFKNQVFDGELLIKNPDGTPNRKLSNGIYTKLVRNTAIKEEVERFSIVLWDMIPLNEYLTGLGTKPYSERLEELNFCFRTAWYTSPVRIVENKNVSTIKECFEFYEEMRNRGEEGAVIKLNSGIWEDKRSKNCIKLKAEEDISAKIVGFIEGTGKYVGMLGSFRCITECGIEFNVGTGFSDKQRKEFSSSKIGEIIDVKYNEIISNKTTSTKSLFLPVFLKERPDLTF